MPCLGLNVIWVYHKVRLHIDTLHAVSFPIIFSKECITKALIRLRGSAGWSAPSLSHVAKSDFLASEPRYVPFFSYYRLDFCYDIFKRQKCSNGILSFIIEMIYKGFAKRLSQFVII